MDVITLLVYFTGYAGERRETSRMSDRADPFEWSGGHPALDLVNTLDERPSPSPIDNLASYRDLTRFVVLAGLVDRRTAARLQQFDSTSPHVAKRAASFASIFTTSSLPRTRDIRRGNPISTRYLPRSRRHMRPGRWSHRPRPDWPAVAGLRRWRVKFRCTPVRSRSSACSLTSRAKESANAEPRTATSTTSTPARAGAGNGAA